MMFGLKLREVKIKRYVVAAIVWASSGLVFALSIVTAKEMWDAKALTAFVFPWIALFVMSVGWIFNKKVNWLWPISGTLSGAYAFTLGGAVVLFYAPLAFPFAMYLTVFHLRGSAK